MNVGSVESNSSGVAASVSKAQGGDHQHTTNGDKARAPEISEWPSELHASDLPTRFSGPAVAGRVAAYEVKGGFVLAPEIDSCDLA